MSEDTHARTPWTAEQVRSLNDYQASGVFHEYTCGNEHLGIWYEDEGGSLHFEQAQPVLTATEDGWVCPDPECGYTQTWAHWWTGDPVHREGTARLPAMPPAVAKVANDDDLILWEASWRKIKSKLDPPPVLDPAILEHVTGSLYVVKATWDLTELEAAALR